ncbi:hypothetical protein ON010_g17992 [Phytophthora cinnamomi]|nr:hypothetical protein ON010_g17992 [Phytophthora cinnamomi]
MQPNSHDAKHAEVDALDKKRREQQRRRMVKWRRIKKDNLGTSLETAAAVLLNADAKLWPVVVSASSWGLSQTGEVYCHALQSFSTEARVLVCNIPGNVNFRYIALAQHTSERIPDGKCVGKFSIILADSKENARTREVEGPREDVRWVLEGGTHVTITEVGDNVVDVVYDHWAGCASEFYGRVDFEFKAAGYSSH